MKNNADKMVDIKGITKLIKRELQTFSDKIEDFHEKYFVYVFFWGVESIVVKRY